MRQTISVKLRISSNTNSLKTKMMKFWMIQNPSWQFSRNSSTIQKPTQNQFGFSNVLWRKEDDVIRKLILLCLKCCFLKPFCNIHNSCEKEKAELIAKLLDLFSTISHGCKVNVLLRNDLSCLIYY